MSEESEYQWVNPLCWETESVSLDHTTGEFIKVRGDYIIANTLKIAALALKKKKLNHLTLTGKSVTPQELYPSTEEVDIVDIAYEELKEAVSSVIGDMTLDQFSDWLDLAEDLQHLLDAKERIDADPSLSKYSGYLKGYIKNKFPEYKGGEDNG